MTTLTDSPTYWLRGLDGKWRELGETGYAIALEENCLYDGMALLKVEPSEWSRVVPVRRSWWQRVQRWWSGH